MAGIRNLGYDSATKVLAVTGRRFWESDDGICGGGAFTLFLPGQHSALHATILAPEGRIFFAGEHTSLAHSWMQGALESGLRATREMLEAAQRG